MQMYAKLPMSPNAANDNKSLFSFLRTLPEFVRRTPLLLSGNRQSAIGNRQSATVQQSIDISCPLGPQQQSRARIDKRSDTVLLHRPCSVHYAGSANKQLTIHCRRALLPRTFDGNAAEVVALVLWFVLADFVSK